MQGVVKGVFYCNMDRAKVTGERIYERNIPTNSLQMSYTPRSVPTRGVLMPILDCRIQPTVPRERMPIYTSRTMFSPGTSLPFGGYQAAVNIESELRNIIFPLQDCPQAAYIPGTSSDLYTLQDLIPPPRKESREHALLFKETKFDAFNPNLCHLGNKLFNNFTRYQVRDLPEAVNMLGEK